MRARDFQAIAGAVKSARDSLSRTPGIAQGELDATMDSMSRDLADTLARQSGRFQRIRFLSACGCNEESLKKACNFPGALLVS